MKYLFNIIMLLTLSFAGPSVFAQSELRKVLDEIGTNNPSLNSGQYYMEAKQLEFRTGNTPDDLIVNYAFLKGAQGAGNQTEILVAQAFDFPTVYAKRKQLADAQSAQTEHEFDAIRSNVMQEATKVCFELVYLRKEHQLLEEQKVRTSKVLQQFEERFKNGDGTKLDVGKARLQLLDVNRSMAENEVSISGAQATLLKLNGGNQISFEDTIYQTLNMPPLDTLLEEWQSEDPIAHMLQQQSAVSEKQIALSKSMWLPKLEAGYRHVSGFGQSFNGVHTGISVPIWENRNMVKLRKAEQQYSLSKADAYFSEKGQQVKMLYDRHVILKATLEEYVNTLAEFRNAELLQASLELGHINATEYFMEMNYYVDTFTNQLRIEQEYHTLVAELLKYRL